jgi:FixJ family two-component response regulator
MANRQVPIIFMTARRRADERASDEGRCDRVSHQAVSRRALRERFSTLSGRQREIMVQITAGRVNKKVADNVGISVSTVKVHRTHLMRKMKARSLPELSRMADVLELRPE